MPSDAGAGDPGGAATEGDSAGGAGGTSPVAGAGGTALNTGGDGAAIAGGAAGTSVAVGGESSSAGAASAEGGAAGSAGAGVAGGGAAGEGAAGGGAAGAAGAGAVDPCSPTNGGFESCDGLDNDCNGDVDERGCPATCRGEADAGSGYMLCDTQVTWSEAEAACAAENLMLVTIETAQKNQTLIDLMFPADGSLDLSFFWIGLSRPDSASPFTWADGSPLGDYANWKNGVPGTAGSAHCTQVTGAGEWVESRCDFVKRYACELQ